MTPFEEKDLYEFMGLEVPQPEEDPETGTSANTAEVAAGGEAANTERREASETNGTGSETGTEPEREPMAKDDRARFAEMRRKRESEEAVRRALEEQEAKNRAEWQKFFAAAGMKDADGNPITNREEYEAAQQAQKMRQISTNLKRGNLVPEDLQTLIKEQLAAETPKKVLNDVGQRHPNAGQPDQQKQTAGNVTEDMIRQELEEIGKLDPGVKTLEDILKLETGKDFAAEVKRGASFLSAFKIANFDRLQQMQREETASRAKQAALNSQRGKEHLTTSTSKGQGSVPVPAEELALYRRLNPKATDAEISAHYNKIYKQLK